MMLSSCGEYNTVLKSTDYEFKYEAAKGYFAKGQNSRAATLLEELIPILKGTTNAEESAYMLAMTYFNQGDYISASHYFNVYYTTYPRGHDLSTRHIYRVGTFLLREIFVSRYSRATFGPDQYIQSH